jgi:prepilin-type N-terminal cleavage/methylation domain-containing protein
MQRLPPPRRRRAAFTLLELLVVLVLLGLSAAFVIPTLRLPAPASDAVTPLERARATAVRRGESVRLTVEATGAWSVRATADTLDTILLSGTGTADRVHAVVISALGVCLPEGAAPADTRAWDPVRCAAATH